MTSALPRHQEPRGALNRGLHRQPDQPLRLLLLRDKVGELPWMVQTIMRVMAPVEVVPVKSLANALWRLGRERFDTVILDVSPGERQIVEACRRHIADVAAIPVLDLNDDEDVNVIRPKERDLGAPPAGAAGSPRSAEAARGPRPPRRAESEDEGGRGHGGLWPPRAGKRRVPRGRPAHLGGALLGG